MSDPIDRAAEIARRERTVLKTCEARRITPGPSSASTLLTALVSVLNDMPAHDAAVAAKALREASEALKAESTEWHGEDMRHHSGEPSDCECSDDGLCHEYARFTALNGRAPIWLRERADRIEREGGSDAQR